MTNTTYKMGWLIAIVTVALLCVLQACGGITVTETTSTPETETSQTDESGTETDSSDETGDFSAEEEDTDGDTNGDTEDSNGEDGDSSLPDISSFKTTPTDQFLMDLSLVIDGHSFRGQNSVNPHAGGHLYLNNAENTWPTGGTNPEHYPPVYAIADGVVDHITTYLKVGDNYRYGVSITVATKEGDEVNFLYSIEPMIDPGDSEFYKNYILVEPGQTVSKGDIIAYFYLAPNDTSNNAHIHFHMNYKSVFLAPCLFTEEIVTEFHSKFDSRGTDGGTPLPNAMCYKLSAEENPFEAVAVDTL